MTAEARDTAIREAKIYIREIVRNDWTFAPSSDSLPASSTPTPPAHANIAEWRLREYDSSGSELEPQSSPPGSPPPAFEGGGFGGDRRRKRRRQEEEDEMRWNEGLRTWVERRDQWSGAKTRAEIEGVKDKEVEMVDCDGEGVGEGSGLARAQGDDVDGPSGTGNESDLAARTEGSLSIAEKEEAAQQSQSQTLAQAQAQSQSQPKPTPQSHEEQPSTTADQEPPHTNTESPAKNKEESSSTAITEPENNTPNPPTSTPAPAPATAAATAIASSKQHQHDAQECHDRLLPVIPSIIPLSNPIRAAITPSMYPSIYSKVVLQGLTPTVPINLADLTNAMVQGWKSDGQWPPKPATTNLVLQDDATVRPRPDAADGAAGGPSSPESKKRSGLASTVRKVLHFSGFHPHPFHRRGSSHGAGAQQGGAEDAQAEGAAAGLVDDTKGEK